MKAAELRDKNIAELKKDLLAQLKVLFDMRMQRGKGEKVALHLFKTVRRDVARIKMVLKEKMTHE